ncbi:hypothetical protein V1460_20750 [Streptomyces sp. SCSIO 30461]
MTVLDERPSATLLDHLSLELTSRCQLTCPSRIAALAVSPAACVVLLGD